jgi:hypothetical protein
MEYVPAVVPPGRTNVVDAVPLETLTGLVEEPI